MEVRGPIVHCQVGQRIGSSVHIGSLLRIALGVGQVDTVTIVLERTRIGGRFVPHAVSHQDVVTRPAGIGVFGCVLIGFDPRVRVFVPSYIAFKKFAGSLHCAW
ncbi:hypothetical protein D3C77_550730 [compost metagenome]